MDYAGIGDCDAGDGDTAGYEIERENLILLERNIQHSTINIQWSFN